MVVEFEECYLYFRIFVTCELQSGLTAWSLAVHLFLDCGNSGQFINLETRVRGKQQQEDQPREANTAITKYVHQCTLYLILLYQHLTHVTAGVSDVNAAI